MRHVPASPRSSVLTGRPCRLTEKNFGAAGDQKVWHRSDFLITLLAVKVACARIEVGDAGKEVFGPGKHQGFDVRQQLPPCSLVPGPLSDSQQFQIVTEQEFLTDEGNAGDPPPRFRDEAFAALRKGAEDA